MPTLRRTLGRWDLTAIGVNQVVGAAIFLLPADVARQVGSWGPVMFAAIGLTSLLVALCFAEVGSRFETTGGPIGPARVAFGRFVGFEVGWMLWFSRVSSGASVINGLALALGFYWPALSSGLPRALVILGVLGGLTWANLRGIKQASWLVNGFTIGKILPLVIFVLVGIWAADFSRVLPSGLPPLADASAAALLLIFAYGGYEVTGVPAGEALEPAPRRAVRLRGDDSHRHHGDDADRGGRHRRAARRGRDADADRRRLGAADGRGRRAADQPRVGHLDDRQQHGPAAERLALRVRPGRARRPAGGVRARASRLTARPTWRSGSPAWCSSRWRSAARSCSWPR